MDPHRHVTRPARRRARWTRDVLSVLARTAALLAILVGTGAAVVVVLGLRPYVITSGSMTPTLRKGDLVLDRPVTVSQLQPGDIVTFASGVFGGQNVTHRVVSTEPAADGQITVVTRGDANSGSEAWTAPPAARVGVTSAHLPYAGWWFAALSSRLGRVTVILLVTSFLLVTALRRVWGAA